jgi:hypothetical protein
MSRLSYPSARKMLREILLSAPDTRYLRSTPLSGYYFNPLTGEPCCVVGHIFVRIGVEYEDVSASLENKTALEALEWVRIMDRMTVRAMTFLREAQCMQDNERSWGEIYEDLFESEEG